VKKYTGVINEKQTIEKSCNGQFKVVISLNLRSFVINIPFAVDWNPYGAK